MIKQSVLSQFPSFTAALEGQVSTMYLDIKGLITIGLGCLIDPVTLATGLPFRIKGGDVRATPAQIANEWNRLKRQPELANYHYSRAAAQCQLYLSPDAIDDLARSRIALFESQLTKYLPQFPDWPADAQFATLSMAWAMGAGFVPKFPQWEKAAEKQDWEACSRLCLMRTTGNPGLRPRNEANVRMFLNAAKHPSR
jgi:GH24 family phage-related lysozyme (muramidase)